ncbi:MAG: hypothetical protein WAW96_01315 [Alphaproteobacteria bacterium]
MRFISILSLFICVACATHGYQGSGAGPAYSHCVFDVTYDANMAQQKERMKSQSVGAMVAGGLIGGAAGGALVGAGMGVADAPSPQSIEAAVDACMTAKGFTKK